MRKAAFLFLLAFSLPIFPRVTIMSYNVENLFYPETDSLNPDTEFTKEGNRRWTFARFNYKVEQIARVIANAGHPDIICLNEIEDANCLNLLCRKMPHYPYKYIHFDSPDKRGIDVAMLYDTTLFQPIMYRPYTVHIPNYPTRDILYVKLRVKSKNLPISSKDLDNDYHIISCHLPSQLGGYTNSQWKREIAKDTIRHLVDSILQTTQRAQIIVCGDMNMPPVEDITNMQNKMLQTAKKHSGTHKYKGQWTCLDQFYVSHALISLSTVTIFNPFWLQQEDKKYLGLKPKRTYNGFRYNRDGFSDHLPILLLIE